MCRTTKFKFAGTKRSLKYTRQLTSLSPASIALETKTCRLLSKFDAVCLLADEIFGPLTTKWYVKELKVLAGHHG